MFNDMRKRSYEILNKNCGMSNNILSNLNLIPDKKCTKMALNVLSDYVGIK